MSQAIALQPDMFGYAQENSTPSATEMLKKLSAIVDQKGMLVPVKLSALLLDVSTQRVYELMQKGRLERIECYGHVFVTENSLHALADSERAAGRPLNTPKTKADAWKRARKFAEKK